MEISVAQLRVRSARLLTVVLLWALTVTGALFYFCYLAREHYTRESMRLAWRTGVFQAVRGRIIDRNNTPLAWTVRHYDLILCRSISPERGRVLLRELRRIVMIKYADLSLVPTPQVLAPELTAAQVDSLSSAFKTYPEIQLVSHSERMVAGGWKVRLFVGDVSMVNGHAAGISGLEQKYDRELSGRNGVYKVMVDRSGRWVNGTWQVITHPENGLDVKVDIQLDDLNAGRLER